MIAIVVGQFLRWRGSGRWGWLRRAQPPDAPTITATIIITIAMIVNTAIAIGAITVSTATTATTAAAAAAAAAATGGGGGGAGGVRSANRPCCSRQPNPHPTDVTIQRRTAVCQSYPWSFSLTMEGYVLEEAFNQR